MERPDIRLAVNQDNVQPRLYGETSITLLQKFVCAFKKQFPVGCNGWVRIDAGRQFAHHSFLIA